MIRFLLLTSCAVVVTGCPLLSTGKRPGYRYFALEQPICDDRTVPSKTVVITLAPSSADSGIDTDRMMYARNEIERGFYQYSFWVSSPVQQFNTLLRRELTCDGLTDNRAERRLLLETRMLEFFHDAENQPGDGRVSVFARAIDASTTKEVSSRTFSAHEQASDFSAEGAAHALSRAADQVAKEVADWIKALPASN